MVDRVVHFLLVVVVDALVLVSLHDIPASIQILGLDRLSGIA